MILMIDNYDSFTYNIVQYCYELGANLKIVRNDKIDIDGIKRLNPAKIIISPGPATPNEAGICLDAIKCFSDSLPILGVCLGHQAIAQAFGAEIIRAKNLMHGKTSTVKIVKDTPIFKDIPENFTATRYHSLVVNQKNIPDIVIPTAYSIDDNEIMALEIKDRAVYGVQFHPESIMSQFGYKILENFLNL
ncbi:MAG: aminodeoxychorismate/anthranilate synthase component II [Campylobacterales bacterium]|nr:aminodeoxychorismate/anthranilate synthase component II [Campylobacterales bacterium]